MTGISLADEPAFTLGDLTVRPALRQIVCTDGSEHILEPRVMQVLVALTKAQGGIVSRDRLIEQCWEGRIVGEDAINRVIGRLRQFAQADAANAFRIETVPRVGYRLLLRDQTETQGLTAPSSAVVTAPSRPNRRALLLGAAGGALAAAVAAGAYWTWLRRPPAADGPPPEVAALMASANQAALRGTPEGVSEGMGLFRRVVEIAPQYADGWGGLALMYAFLSHGDPQKAAANRLLAIAALQKTLALDPHNAFAYGAKAALNPWRGHWFENEGLLREGLRYHPDVEGLNLALSNLLSNVGRMNAAAAAIERAAQLAPAPDPETTWFRMQMLWAANRLQEADAASEHGISLFPRQSSVWFSRLYILLFTARADEALNFLADVDNRPPGIPNNDFDHLFLVATALKTAAPADIDKAVAATMDVAHKGGGFGENAIQFLCALGRIDEAFAVADALYFNRGFTVGIFRFAPEARAYTTLLDRRTRPLFLPSTKPMRRDPRFAKLVDELGLTAYWRKTGIKPDYQSGID